MQLYSLLDKKAMSYGGILIGAGDGHVARVIKERFRGSEDTVAKFPEDFDLYSLGEYDVDSGVITSQVKFVVNLSVILSEKE